MKAIFNILFFLILTVGFSQTIFPLEQMVNHTNKQGKYFKDVNGILDAFTGVWRWQEGNRELTFYFYKDEASSQQSLSGSYLRDVVFGYYVYKESGVTLIDSKQDLLNNLSDKTFISRGGAGMMPDNNGYLVSTAPAFYFKDYSKTNCLNDVHRPMQGSPGYWRFENPTTARVGLFTAGLQLNHCGTNDLYPNFPSNSSITLTKIANVAPPLN